MKEHWMKILVFALLLCLFNGVSTQAAVIINEPGYRSILLTEGLSKPQDVVNFHPGGGYGPNLFVTEYGADRVTKIAPNGTKTPHPGALDYPVAILFGSGSFGNYLYVGESYSTDGNIIRLSPSGDKYTFATGIDSPLDMVWGMENSFGSDLYVASTNANKIVKVSPAGVVSDFANGLSRPSVLAFGPGDAFGTSLYVTNTSGGEVSKVDSMGKSTAFLTELDNPVGLAFGNNTPFGNFLYVSESKTGEIIKISPDGARTTFAEGFEEPVEIHFSKGGEYANDMLVVDDSAGKIYRIKNLAAYNITILPLPADVVDTTPFSLSFTLGSPSGFAGAASFKFYYNNTDVTALLIDYFVANITEATANKITVTCPNLSFGPGVHKIKILLSDVNGRVSSAQVTYTIPE